MTIRQTLRLVLAAALLWGAWGAGPAAAIDLRAALSSSSDISVEGQSLPRDELRAFYAARDFRPLWNAYGAGNDIVFAAFLDSLDRLAEYHGLYRGHYPTALMRRLAADPPETSQEKLELLVTATLLRLAHDLHGDSLDLSDLYPGWTLHRAALDIPAAVAAATASNTLNAFIAGLVPKNPAYAQLAKALQLYRHLGTDGAWPKIDPGPTLRPGERSQRVTQLRARLAAENKVPAAVSPQAAPAQAPEDPTRYDDALKAEVEAWQTRYGLAPDGNIGGKTLEALNVPLPNRINQIRANMERWRHMPDDFPPGRYALVNIASAMLDIVDDGKALYEGPVVIGRVDRKTPFIQSKIRSMIVNPSWHVPDKIARKDILPKLRRDPHYLEKLGFVISGNEDDPHGANIDWDSMPAREFNFRLRQSPGDMNSLGRLKFDFDNDFSVYMHGTPHQELFAKYERAFSSGCIRLRDPEEVGAVVLSANDGNWDAKKIDQQIGAGKTRWVAVARPLPLYVLYGTVLTDSSGAVSFRKDIYGYDRFLVEQMDGRGI